VAAIRYADRAAESEAALGEIQAVADGASAAVVLAPPDEIRGDAALHHEILDEVAHLVVDEGRAHRGSQTETFPEPARGVVFAAAFPNREMPGGAHPALARVEPEHDFAEGDLVKRALFGRLDRQRHGERCKESTAGGEPSGAALSGEVSRPRLAVESMVPAQA